MAVSVTAVGPTAELNNSTAMMRDSDEVLH